MTTPSATNPAAIPALHLDLLTGPVRGVFTTVGTFGQPQSTLVWIDFDGACARINTTLESEKGRNLLANPKVSLLVVDRRHQPLPPDPRRRRAHHRRRRRASRRPDPQIPRHPSYDSHIYPLALRESETRVICRIHPLRVIRDAVHSARIQKGDPHVRDLARIVGREGRHV